MDVQPMDDLEQPLIEGSKSQTPSFKDKKSIKKMLMSQIKKVRKRKSSTSEPYTEKIDDLADKRISNPMFITNKKKRSVFKKILALD